MFKHLLTDSEYLSALSCAKRLDLDVNHLLAAIYFETGKTMSPSKTNNIGSVGLIQFTRDKSGVDYKTIAGKKYQLAVLKAMTFEQQMEVVFIYLKEASKGKSLKTFIDIYFTIFFPNAIGQPDSFVLQTKNLTKSLIARQNPIFDTNKDGLILKSEVDKFFETYFSKPIYSILKKKQ